jgi:hypothetical protein
MSTIMGVLVVIIGLAYLGGAGYASYRVYLAVYNNGVKPGGITTIASVEAIMAAIATMFGLLAIPFSIANYTFLYSVYRRDGIWGVLPFIAAERLLR